MAKAKLLALLTRDHRALAEQQIAAGHKDKAAQLYLRAGEFVHRDLKPSNVFLTPLRLKILDFGIARQLGSDTRLTATGFAVGSPAYMSPEQLQGVPLDGRSDLYSAGILAFIMLAGREPFSGPTAAALAVQHLQQPPPDLRCLRPDLPAGWPELVARLLAKRPADRFQSAAVMGEAVAALPVGPPASP